MVEFTESQQALIEDLFSEFNNKGIQYVIPRGYWELPKSVLGGDIDVLVHENDYPKAISVVNSIGFKTSSQTIDILNLLREGIQKYPLVFRYLITEPSILYNEVRDVVSDNDTEEVATSYLEYKGHKDNVMVHLMNHLAYTSPLNGQKIRVDPSVEESMHKRSKRYKIFSRPSKPDELAHLVCRGVFDKRGDFPRYYIERCDQLWQDIRDDDKLQSEFNELLSQLFFDADKVVTKVIQSSNYDSLKDELIRFSEY
jgi:hypothetical protein